MASILNSINPNRTTLDSKTATGGCKSKSALSRLLLSGIVFSVLGGIAQEATFAQSITPSSGTGTVINQNGNSYDISGGRLSGDGKNLFQSFQRFGLSSQEIANFLSNPNIENILGRVTSGNASIINGSIRVTGGNSNLYLMNPAGIIFGNNASLNVPASFTATTATGIGFGANGWFSATGNNNYDALVGTPTSFGFTTSNPGAIVNAGNLAVESGQNLSLISGTAVSTGQLSAPAGNVIVAAVPGTNLVRLSQLGSVLSLEIQPFAPGESQPNRWTVPILSLPRLLTGSVQEAGVDTGLSVNSDSKAQVTGTNIIVNRGDVVTGNVSTSGLSNGGSILISAQRSINNTSSGTLDSSSSNGNGGAVTLNARKDIAAGSINTRGVNSNTTSSSTTSGGAITLNATNGGLTTGNLNSSASGYDANSGTISLTAGKGDIETGAIDSHAVGFYQANGGAITLATQRGKIATNNIDSSSSGSGSPAVAINVNSGAIALTARGNITTGDLSSSSSQAFGTVRGGAIQLASQNGNITTGAINSRAQGRLSNGGGTINLTTHKGDIATGYLISTSSGFAGSGGAITLSTDRGKIATGDINTTSSFSGRTGTSLGNGGAVTLTASNSITSNRIDTSSNLDLASPTAPNEGKGGAVSLIAANGVTVRFINTRAGGTGTGGNVTIAANRGTVRVLDSFITASNSTGVTTASIATQGGNGGGSIIIVNGGGAANPFKVGDATTNGTAQAITSGNFTISPAPVFTVPSPVYTLGNTTIVTPP